MNRMSVCILVMVAFFLGTPHLVLYTNAQQVPSSIASGIELKIDFGNGSIVVFSDIEGTDVLTITEERLDLVVEWYGNLAYVTSIDGVANDPQTGLFWQYWVNNERAPVAANLMTLNDNDHVLWIRTSSTYTGSPPEGETDYGVLIGIIFIAIWGPTFLGVLQVTTTWRTKRQ